MSSCDTYIQPNRTLASSPMRIRSQTEARAGVVRSERSMNSVRARSMLSNSPHRSTSALGSSLELKNNKCRNTGRWNRLCDLDIYCDETDNDSDDDYSFRVHRKLLRRRHVRKLQLQKERQEAAEAREAARKRNILLSQKQKREALKRSLAPPKTSTQSEKTMVSMITRKVSSNQATTSMTIDPIQFFSPVKPPKRQRLDSVN